MSDQDSSLLDPLVESVTAAYERMFDLLFRDFDVVRYLLLGLLAFFSSCGEPSLSFNVDIPDIPLPQNNDELLIFFAAQSGYLLMIAFFVVVGIAVGVLFLFISSRTLMAFFDAIITGEPKVDALTEKGSVANRLFLFRASYVVGVPLLGLCAMFLLMVLSIGVQLAFGAEFMALGQLLGVGVGFLALPVILILYLFDRLVMELAAPIMYVQGTSVIESFQLLRAAPNADAFQIFVFLVARFVIGLLITILTFPLSCLCFCLMLIPGMSAMILLPFTVFSRNISMQWLARMDPAYAGLASGSLEADVQEA